MIYKPGDVVTISTWNTGAPGGDTLQLRIAWGGLAFNSVTAPDSGGNFTLKSNYGASPDWIGKVTSGSLTTAACTIQLTIPTAFLGTAGRYRSRVMLTRGQAQNGRYVYLDILNNDLYTDYRPATSCALDRNGRLHALVGTRDGMALRRYGGSLSAVETLGTIPNAVEGAIVFTPSNRLYAFVNMGDDPSAASSTWERADLRVKKSDDMGRTFPVSGDEALPASVAMPDHSPFVDANSPTIYSSLGVRVGAVASGPAGVYASALNRSGLPGASAPFYALVSRGGAWEVMDFTNWSRVVNAGFRKSVEVFRVIDGVGSLGSRANASAELNTGGRVVTDVGIMIATRAKTGASSYQYDYWRQFDGLTAPAAVTNRAAGPQGAAVPGSTFLEAPSHTLWDSRTGEIHLTDGLKYWASSTDLGRSWTDRNI